MTAIVALFDGHKTFLAADRLSVVPDGPHSYVAARKSEKVLTAGPWTIAAAGFAGILDLLLGFENDIGEAESAADFFERARSAFRDLGVRPIRLDEDDAEGGLPSYPCEFILCRPGECWASAGMLLPWRIEPGRPFAIGSACVSASAATWAVLQLGIEPGRAVAAGIAAAAEYITGIGSEAVITVVGQVES